MTPDQAAMVAFLRDRYADSIDLARSMENLAATGQLPGLNVAPSQAVDFGGVHAAESRLRFLDETVIPYLGTAGPTGRIADHQLRLLAWEHQGARGYQEGWAP
ncbi:hypothetical protein OG762_36875 [Streptomyces sp. NBC_01136]|uniref:hypothetical protein n=1 Tax=Streptomyces sp. NBC_01136 TaxID=2903754 RepID=UPI0038670DA8|nr:hypothetical protein OG762_36875 [Streptomyces sp. NBC_01136]